MFVFFQENPVLSGFCLHGHINSLKMMHENIFLFYVNFIHWLEQHLVPCLFKNFFHIECPGCGLQRSVLELLKGNVASSVGFYPALIPMLIYFTYLVVGKKYPAVISPKLNFYGLISIFAIISISYIIKLN